MQMKYLTLALVALITAGCATAPRLQPHLGAFASDAELQEYFAKAVLYENSGYRSGMYTLGSPGEEYVIVTGSRITAADIDRVTNIQVEGVDEGGIVKRIGKHVVLLRRGRLFSFALDGAGYLPRAVDYIDVAPSEGEAWYDEILVHEDTILLLGYSYESEALELRRFHISNDGKFSAGEVSYFPGSDYFDDENYAARLVGNQLIFYFGRWLTDITENSDGNAIPYSSPFRDEVVYRPLLLSDEYQLHTIASCPVTTTQLECVATSVVGPATSKMFVSQDAVYLWMSEYGGHPYDFNQLTKPRIRQLARADILARETTVLYRLPLDRSAPGVIATAGTPLNAYSFEQSESVLRVFVDFGTGSNSIPGLWQIPLSRFGSELGQPDYGLLRRLPELPGDLVENRFVDQHVIYADADGENETFNIWTASVNSTDAPDGLQLPFRPHRIEALGSRALVVGSSLQDAITYIQSLDPTDPASHRQLITLPGRIESESRSHGFNYRPVADDYLFGLPLITVPPGGDGDEFLYAHEDGLIGQELHYFQLGQDLLITPVGILTGSPPADDFCLVSCEDWYGNARPFFIGDVIYALLGYELVAAYMSGNAVIASGRANGLELLEDPQLQ